MTWLDLCRLLPMTSDVAAPPTFGKVSRRNCFFTGEPTVVKTVQSMLRAMVMAA